MLSPADILTALRDCYDPSLPCNIVDLGIVRELTVTPDSEAPGTGIPGVPARSAIRIVITPASSAADASALLTGQIRNRLAGLETASRAEVVVDPVRPWSPADITPAGRRTLGLDGNRSLVQIR